jgi:hypothetical protein
MTAGVRLEDLPADVRARLAAAGVTAPRAPKSRAVAVGATTVGWVCHTCGVTSTVWAQMERHAHANHHGRIDIPIVLA